MSNIEVTESNIKGFDRVARKYGVDYAIKKDKSGEIPKYLVFFKARDADALTAAFTEYSGKKAKNKEMLSLLRYISNNINQIAKRLNESGRAYETDFEDILEKQEQLWGLANEILMKLSAIQ